jgi:hypothetical protein
MLIRVDNLWEHQCAGKNLVRDVRKIVELREQIHLNEIVGAVYEANAMSDK